MAFTGSPLALGCKRSLALPRHREVKYPFGCDGLFLDIEDITFWVARLPEGGVVGWDTKVDHGTGRIGPVLYTELQQSFHH